MAQPGSEQPPMGPFQNQMLQEQADGQGGKPTPEEIIKARKQQSAWIMG